MTRPVAVLFITHIFLFFIPSFAVDFLYNSFGTITNGTNLILINDARIDSSAVRLTNDSNQFSFGRAYYPQKLTMKPSSNSNTLSSFSTSFVFSVLPKIASSPGFGLCFVLTNLTSPPGALASQYFGLFTNATVPVVAPLLAVEFDTGRNPEFNDPDDNHIGIDLNNLESIKVASAGYYTSSSSNGSFVPVRMKSGQNIHAWIDFDGTNFEINVTIAPIGVPKPSIPTLNYKDQAIANYVSNEMFVGFSASKTDFIEAQRILAWSLSDTGVAREINTTNLPVFSLSSSSSSLSDGAIAGIVIGCVVFVIICASGVFWFWRKHMLKDQEEEEIEDWELEYWPHRFSYEELSNATDGFSKENLLGSDMTTEDDDEAVLKDWVRELYGQGRLIEAADRRIREEYKIEEMEMALKLGLACCHPDPMKRPDMKDVVAILVGADAATPKELLGELARSGGDDVVGGSSGGGWGDSTEEAPLRPEPPV
ncbi:hypothetical protein LWI29_022408 [Acer saccharum]|uniref:non-specific serine/threonine protein kinase n=1 Tax=Acer saccharum TaxID=4024 RepID=A0AA39VJ76_ACESA|nr:hypothetical protein LWI29_022408 [Acer saccharum]